MIQRVQSVYLLIVMLINGILPFWIPLRMMTGEQPMYAYDTLFYGAFFFGSASIALSTIFLYKKRKYQFVLNRINMLVNITVLGLFVYTVLGSPKDNIPSGSSIGMLLPVFAVIFLVLANKAIRKDEALVRSADRLR